MTRPDYQVAELTATNFDSEWSNHNNVGGSFITKPGFIEVEDPGAGQSSRSLPADKRTTPYVYVYDDDSIMPEFDDVNWNSQRYSATVRLEVIVADDMQGKTGKQMRDDIIQVFENIREDSRSPVDGVFGTDWQSLELVNIDKTPSRFSNQWRAYYDIMYEALGVI